MNFSSDSLRTFGPMWPSTRTTRANWVPPGATWGWLAGGSCLWLKSMDGSDILSSRQSLEVRWAQGHSGVKYSQPTQYIEENNCSEDLENVFEMGRRGCTHDSWRMFQNRMTVTKTRKYHRTSFTMDKYGKKQQQTGNIRCFGCQPAKLSSSSSISTVCRLLSNSSC